MTEDEAKTKWCPFARLCGDGSNRGFNPQCWGEVQCIGSQCMAWRWKIELLKITPKTGHSYITNEENVNFIEIGSTIEKIEKEGYCGLAGKL